MILDWAFLLTLLITLVEAFTDSTSKTVFSMNAVVTGANRGLGLEICKQLVETSKYERVFAICRKVSPDLAELAQKNGKLQVVNNVDIMEHADSATLLKELFQTDSADPTPIHLLLQNAGAYGPPEEYENMNDRNKSQNIDNITLERLRFAFELNTAAPLLLTQALLPNLRAAAPNAKVAIVSSAMGSISENTSGGHYAYRTSKAAVNMVGKGLSVDLRPEGIAVGMIHPGFVYTGFGGAKERVSGQRDVDVSVRGVLQAVDEISLSNTGCFLHGNYGEGVQSIQC